MQREVLNNSKRNIRKRVDSDHRRMGDQNTDNEVEKMSADEIKRRQMGPMGALYQMREEPLRKMGKYGIAMDDFIKRQLGQESYYDRQAREENNRYWSDYFENTGVEREDVKYPIKMGVQHNAPIQTIPGITVSGTKRAINMLYGGQE